MKAKLTTIDKNGKVTNHRGTVDPETWAPRKIDFLEKIYKFDNITFSNPAPGSWTLDAYRSKGIPGTNGKEMEVHFILTQVD